MFENTVNLILNGVGRLYPGAAVAIGVKDNVYVRQVFGNRIENPNVAPMTLDTLFDIASLSKIICTTMLTLKFIEQGRINLNDKISNFFECAGNYSDCDIFQLLTHTSGIPAWMPLYSENSPHDVFQFILNTQKNSNSPIVDYSCLGYILLGKILEKVGGETLDKLANEYVFSPLCMNNTCFNPDKELPIASTEKDEHTGNWLTGIVHDENARFLGGISGNAGVFSNLDDMIKFTKMCALKGKINNEKMFLSPEIFEKAITNYTNDLKESRGLGFQVKGNQDFSGGNHFSIGSFGHTGFTGTSLYIDNQTGLWSVLLTNTVHYGREHKPEFIAFRKEIHKSMLAEYISLLKEDKI